MAILTANLKLIKPEVTDNITPTIFADNFDIIDEAIMDRMPITGGTFQGNVRVADGYSMSLNGCTAEVTFRGIQVYNAEGTEAQNTRNLIMYRK